MGEADPAYLYRFTNLGEALQDALQDFINSDEINESIRENFLSTFDEAFYTNIDQQKTPFKKFSVQGHLHTYRQMDKVWTFFIQHATIKSDDPPLIARPKMLKIVSVQNSRIEKQQDLDLPKKRSMDNFDL